MSDTLHWFKSSYSDDGGGECVEVAFGWRTSSYSDSGGGNCVEVGYDWHKSSYSDDGGGSCVEVATCRHSVHVRDSKVQDGPTFTVEPSAWAAFVSRCAEIR
ncbi:DUF397 domain-containing protein [Streptomyces sp. NPDC090025]|uniref:DUF397 domain-containing protein n=1 Tax=Streptomyces sp. NPDC090025 TaxID=3365922 RepID=UPI0038368235